MWVRLPMVLALCLLLFATPVRADEPTSEERMLAIAKDLNCPLGMTMQLDICEAALAMQVKAYIKTRLEQGDTREQIIQYLLGQYGEQILNAPTKQGFNLTAWSLPFVAIFSGGGVVFLVLRGWMARREESAKELTQAEPDSDIYEEKLNKELEEFE